jgi:hypothetical protein
MFWKCFVVGFIMDYRTIKRINDIKMSAIIIDTPSSEPTEDGRDFLSKITKNPNIFSLEEILEKNILKKNKSFFRKGYDERYYGLHNETVLNISHFILQMNLLHKLENNKVGLLDKMEAIQNYEDKIKEKKYSLDLKNGELMKDWDFQIDK